MLFIERNFYFSHSLVHDIGTHLKALGTTNAMTCISITFGLITPSPPSPPSHPHTLTTLTPSQVPQGRVQPSQPAHPLTDRAYCKQVCRSLPLPEGPVAALGPDRCRDDTPPTRATRSHLGGPYHQRHQGQSVLASTLCIIYTCIVSQHCTALPCVCVFFFVKYMCRVVAFFS